MDTRPIRMADGFPGAVDVLEPGAGQPRDDRAPDRLRDRLDGVEVAVGRDRETGLDHVDPQAGELLRDLELLGDVEGDARRLLAVSQCRVEDLHGFHVALPRARCRGKLPLCQRKTLRPVARRVEREHVCVLALT